MVESNDAGLRLPGLVEVHAIFGVQPDARPGTRCWSQNRSPIMLPGRWFITTHCMPPIRPLRQCSTAAPPGLSACAGTCLPVTRSHTMSPCNSRPPRSVNRSQVRRAPIASAAAFTSAGGITCSRCQASAALVSALASHCATLAAALRPRLCRRRATRPLRPVAAPPGGPRSRHRWPAWGSRTLRPGGSMVEECARRTRPGDGEAHAASRGCASRFGWWTSTPMRCTWTHRSPVWRNSPLQFFTSSSTTRRAVTAIRSASNRPRPAALLSRGMRRLLKMCPYWVAWCTRMRCRA